MITKSNNRFEVQPGRYNVICRNRKGELILVGSTSDCSEAAVSVRLNAPTPKCKIVEVTNRATSERAIVEVA